MKYNNSTGIQVLEETEIKENFLVIIDAFLQRGYRTKQDKLVLVHRKDTSKYEMVLNDIFIVETSDYNDYLELILVINGLHESYQILLSELDTILLKKLFLLFDKIRDYESYPELPFILLRICQ